MGYICSPSDENCMIEFYSISDDISLVSGRIFEFIGSLSGGLITMIVTVTIGIFVIIMVLSVRRALKGASYW